MAPDQRRGHTADDADEVAGALLAILASDRTGEAWSVQPGRPAEPFAFRNLPGPRP